MMWKDVRPSTAREQAQYWYDNAKRTTSDGQVIVDTWAQQHGHMWHQVAEIMECGY